MESLGNKLKQTREEKGLTIDQVARETNIARQYIVALEEENYDVFPGEPYLLGFLRNIAECLGLVPDEVISLYKGFKIQEQPVPMEQLIVKQRSGGKIAGVIISIVLLIGVAAGGWFYLNKEDLSFGGSEPSGVVNVSVPEEAEEASVFLFSEESMENDFVSGSRIDVVLGQENFSIKIGSVGDQVELLLGDKLMSLAQGDLLALDLNGDEEGDVTVTAVEIDIDSETVRLSLEKADSAKIAESDAVEPRGVTGNKLPFSEGEASIGSRVVKPLVVKTQNSAEPFAVSIDFRGNCLVRYFSDQQVRQERFFRKGETFRLDVDREIYFWVSNAGSFTARVGGTEVGFGRQGEVATRKIFWTYDENSGGYELGVYPIY